LALVGYEWLIIIGILVVVFLWGPQKLPEIARSVGLAKKEFEKVTKQASSVSNRLTDSTDTSTNDAFVVAAQSLGIVTEDKTKEQIGREIAEKAIGIDVKQ
jgi:sec-independent protein translocase protein TatA